MNEPKTTPEDTWNDDGAECPYCHHVHTDADIDAPVLYNQSGVEVECQQCGKDFVLNANQTWSWSCEPIKQ